MTHEELKNVINDFGNNSTSMCELLQSHAELEEADMLFIENNFATLQMAYAKWKRGLVERRHKGK
jgi:hypothetical protein